MVHGRAVAIQQTAVQHACTESLVESKIVNKKFVKNERNGNKMSKSSLTVWALRAPGGLIKHSYEYPSKFCEKSIFHFRSIFDCGYAHGP